MFLKITRNISSIKFTGIQNQSRVGKARSCRFSFPKPLMDKTCVLEPFTCEEQEDNERGKELWIQVKRLLNSYGLGTETADTFEVMQEQLNMSYDDYILAVCSTRPQFYPKCHPCEIRINDYMHNCLHIWRANHDIQPCPSPYAMIEYILNYKRSEGYECTDGKGL